MNKKDKLIVIGKGYPKENLFKWGGDTYGAVGAAAGAGINAAGKALNKGAHNTTGDVLSAAGSAMPAFDTYSLIAKLALTAAGFVANGLTNSVNKQQVKQKGLEIANFANQTSNATDYNQLQQDYDVLQHQNVDLGTVDDWGSKGVFSSGSKRQDAFNTAKNAYDTAFRMRKNSITQRGQNINLNNTMLQMQNLSAFGGPLNIGDMSGAVNYGFMSDWLAFKNKQAENKNNLGAGTIGTISSSMNGFAGGGPLFALGGDIQSHGGDFTTGLTHIDAGESHEINPNEGVQIGVDSEGVPNLVEEGETVFNDYVYSTRIPIDDITKKRFHIGKKSEMTYADLSKKLEKEVSERPNDPISQAAFKAQMAALAEEQERQKAEMEAARAREAFEALSPEEQTALMQQAAQQEQMAQEQAIQEQAMAEQAAAEQQPTPEEIAMAEQQQQMMQADGSEAALGQTPQMACGGKMNKFDKGGKKNVGKWKDDKENHWDIFTKPGLDKYLRNLEVRIERAPDDETKNAIRREAMNELNSLQQSYFTYVLPTVGSDQYTYSDDILNHQKHFDRLYGNTGFYTTDENGNVRNLIADAINLPKGAATDDKPDNWYDGYSGPRTSIRNFGSTEYGDAKYYQDLVDRFGKIGLTYAPNENWKYGENELYGLSMAEPPAAEEGKAPQVWDWNAGNWVDKPQEQPAAENPGNNGNAEAGTDDDREVVPIHKAEWPRYAGLLAPALGLGMQMAGVGRPDTSGIMAAASRAGQSPVLASYRPIGEYLKYNPFDVNYAANQLRSTSASNRRDILNSNASAGARNAMLLAQNFNDQNALGNLYRQDQEYNNQHRAQVSDFNRGTDQFNAQASTQTSQFNADAINRNRQYASQLAMQAAREKMDADAGWYQGIYGNIGALAKGIGDLGRENAQWNRISDMAATGVFGRMTPSSYIANGMLRYETDEERARRLARKKNSGAKGGKIKRKKGFTY